MSTVKLDLHIEQAVAERVKEYAAQHRTSVSNLAENMFTLITRNMSIGAVEISPLVKSFSLDGVSIPEGFDYKQALAEARSEKYL